MRLTKLKLAGFKSFVDPTAIALPGQLVGVVGPNGCGKSNVIDAVRWVLGESKASELRGESMQDVIFNGSGGRKPVSRAAVELVFDNSLGRAAGQWSQDAELSVKRQLTRSGQSEYYINNLHVRRKDVTDLFLGTGLGPRAYAIIGQGTISRIIEARPDELRVFLEEAAGVTKYKERRKETERRLADTRENLVRVEDIRAELGGQMERLEAQATVARQYRDYQADLTHKQQLLWLLRRNEAQAERERMAQAVAHAVNELEAQHAALRETEARVEEAREHHFSATDGVQSAQGESYQANAEVARLEAEIRHRRESREEYQSRLAQLEADRAQWQADVERYDTERERWAELSTLADERVEQENMRLAAQQERLPAVEAAYAQAQESVNQQRHALSQAEQRWQVELANRNHAQRSLQIIASRRDRLDQERAALPMPDQEEFALKQATLATLHETIAAMQDDLAERQRDLPHFEQRRREALAAVQQAQKERAEAQARRTALEQLQKKMQEDGQQDAWLRRYGLEHRQPLWKSLRVDPGWEDAVEAVLRERLGALTADDIDPAWSKDRPGSRLTLLAPTDGANATAPQRDSLLNRIQCEDDGLQAVLADWLGEVCAADSLQAALDKRDHLRGEACCVTPAGDIVTRQGITLFAPNAAGHGMLERQREIDVLAGVIAGHETRVAQAQENLAAVETALAEAQATLQEVRGELDARQEEAHAIQMETLRLSQALDRFRDRQAQIEAALAELTAEEEEENERLLIVDEAIDAARDAVESVRQQMAQAAGGFEAAGQALREARERVSAAEHALHEAQFSQRECRGKLDDLGKNRDLALRQIERIVDELARCTEGAEAMQAEDLEPLLQTALARRVMCEQALAAARDALEAATGGLRGLEETRMKIEIGLEPLREKIGDLRLKEQAAALNVEQMDAQLRQAQADEAALTPALQGVRAGALQSAISSLRHSIESLGPVNLAALEELESARERKGFLDAQSEDLTQAMETLENAIRRIDRETRELLQTTYNAVNKSFGELFPTLFGGGEARLIMTGEEILDAGLQVMAQPPGKKNSTIHLLSGGEKALTAIALVFAMFQLNPAPFCLLDEVDAPLDDSNTERFCAMVKRMATNTQFLFISHNKIAMEMAEQLVGVTMQESGVSRIVEVDMTEALRMREQIV